MLLDATTKSIEITVEAAATTTESPVTVEYVDHTATTFAPASSDTVSNGTSVVTMVAAPAASTQRQVKEITIYNADTVNHTYTVKYNDNATKRTVVKVAVVPGQALIYRSDIGWVLTPVASAGQLQGTATNDSAAAGNVGEELISSIALASGLSLSNGVAVNVTTLTLTPGEWDVDGTVYLSTSGTTGRISAGISQTSATFTTASNGTQNLDDRSSGDTASYNCLRPGPYSQKVSVNTTIYLVTVVTFGAITVTAFGTLRARRVR